MTDKMAVLRDVLCDDEAKPSASHLDITMAAYLAFVSSLSRPSAGHALKSTPQDCQDKTATLSKWVR